MDNFHRDVLYKISFNHTTNLVIDSRYFQPHSIVKNGMNIYYVLLKKRAKCTSGDKRIYALWESYKKTGRKAKNEVTLGVEKWNRKEDAKRISSYAGWSICTLDGIPSSLLKDITPTISSLLQHQYFLYDSNPHSYHHKNTLLLT